MLRTLVVFYFLLATSAQAAVLKIATLSPDGTSWMNTMRAGAEEVAKRTNNRVKVKFYPGGVMGDEQATLRKMRINQLQGVAVTTGALVDTYKNIEIYSLPFIFRTQAEVNYVRELMDAKLMEGLEKSGLVCFGLAESGFAYILSNEPVRSVADLQKQKSWIPDNETARTAVKAFNLSPIPLPLGDVLAGLQTGLINTVATSPIGAIALQWYTQTKYLTEMPILYSVATLVVSEKVFKKIDPADQKIVLEVMRNSFKTIDDNNKKDNIAAMAALKSQGITFVQPDNQQLAEWRRLSDITNQRLVAEDHIGKPMYEYMQGLLKEFRQSQAK